MLVNTFGVVGPSAVEFFDNYSRNGVQGSERRGSLVCVFASAEQVILAYSPLWTEKQRS